MFISKGEDIKRFCQFLRPNFPKLSNYLYL